MTRVLGPAWPGFVFLVGDTDQNVEAEPGNSIPDT